MTTWLIERNNHFTDEIYMYILTIELFVTIIWNLHFKSFKPAYSIANLGGLYYTDGTFQKHNKFKSRYELTKIEEF